VSGFWLGVVVTVGVVVMACVIAAPLMAEPPHVYLAITGTPPTQELWLDREIPLLPLKLNGPLQQTVERGHVIAFAVSHDGTKVAYLANARAERPLDFEVWAVPITGPPERRLSGNMVSDYDAILPLKFSEHDDFVVYRVGRSSWGDWSLWSSRWAGGSVSISWLIPVGRMVRTDFSFLSGNLVRFSSDYEVDEQYRWYAVPINGICVIRGVAKSGDVCILRELFADGFESGNTEMWL